MKCSIDRPIGVVPALIGAALIASCARVPDPITRSLDNPAHPQAAEAAGAPVEPVLTGAPDPLLLPPGAAPTHHHDPAPAQPPHQHGAGQPAGTIYTCPMHPEVRSEQPGKCPRCGMELRGPDRPAAGSEDGP